MKRASKQRRVRILALAEKLSQCSGIKIPEGSLANIYSAKGCAACRHTGYNGRLLLFELVRISPSIRQQILRKASLDEMVKTAISEGTEQLLLDGINKVSQGITSIEEIIRAAGVSD